MPIPDNQTLMLPLFKLEQYIRAILCPNSPCNSVSPRSVAGIYL
jgi:hypothetical protein